MRRMRAASRECHTLDSKCLALGRSWSTVLVAALGNKATRRIRSTRPRTGGVIRDEEGKTPTAKHVVEVRRISYVYDVLGAFALR